LILTLQGESTNILTVNSKIKAYKKIKAQHWTGRVESGRLEMFSELNFLEGNEFSQNIETIHH